MESNRQLISFDGDLPDPERGTPNNILRGRPQTLTQNLYTDPGEKFFSGIWSSTEGAWRVEYEEHEFCQILSGRIVLTPEGGQPTTYVAGDAFVIPAGFRGTWETLEPVCKRYAIYLP